MRPGMWAPNQPSCHIVFFRLFSKILSFPIESNYFAYPKVLGPFCPEQLSSHPFISDHLRPFLERGGFFSDRQYSFHSSRPTGDFLVVISHSLISLTFPRPSTEFRVKICCWNCFRSDFIRLLYPRCHASSTSEPFPSESMRFFLSHFL